MHPMHIITTHNVHIKPEHDSSTYLALTITSTPRCDKWKGPACIAVRWGQNMPNACSSGDSSEGAKLQQCQAHLLTRHRHKCAKPALALGISRPLQHCFRSGQMTTGNGHGTQCRAQVHMPMLLLQRSTKPYYIHTATPARPNKPSKRHSQSIEQPRANRPTQCEIQRIIPQPLQLPHGGAPQPTLHCKL